MPLFLVGNIDILKEDLWQEYVDGVHHSLEFFSANLVLRGDFFKAISGDKPGQKIVVIEFSDKNEFDKWYNSEVYQRLIPLRDEAANVKISCYQKNNF